MNRSWTDKETKQNEPLSWQIMSGPVRMFETPKFIDYCRKFFSLYFANCKLTRRGHWSLLDTWVQRFALRKTFFQQQDRTGTFPILSKKSNICSWCQFLSCLLPCDQGKFLGRAAGAERSGILWSALCPHPALRAPHSTHHPSSKNFYFWGLRLPQDPRPVTDLDTTALSQWSNPTLRMVATWLRQLTRLARSDRTNTTSRRQCPRFESMLLRRGT